MQGVQRDETGARRGGEVFALAGLGGSNAHGSGFLAAAQRVAREQGAADGLLPGLEMISCTSGAIASTAAYLRGDDLRGELAERIEAVDRATWWLPRGQWATPWRMATVVGLTGVPGVFGGSAQAYAQDLPATVMRLAASGAGWLRALTPNDLLDLVLPARLFVPKLPPAFFTQTAETFNASRIGVVCNSFDVRTGVEYLYANPAGLDRIRDHHDPSAGYGRPAPLRGVDRAADRRSRRPVEYRPIDPDGLRNALWLFYYGFDQRGQVDGAYARSLILDELTFADRMWIVAPVNQRWLGRLPQNLLEVMDLQTELWMGTSRREQVRAIELVNRLGTGGRQALAEGRGDDKRYHPIELETVEIEVNRGYFDYFLESMSVFDQAQEDSYKQLAGSSPAPTGG